MNKQEWIGNKIKKLIKEGKKKDQAVAIAYNMYESMQQGGTKETMPKYQTGIEGTQGAPQNTGRIFNPYPGVYNIAPEQPKQPTYSVEFPYPKGFPEQSLNSSAYYNTTTNTYETAPENQEQYPQRVYSPRSGEYEVVGAPQQTPITTPSDTLQGAQQVGQLPQPTTQEVAQREQITSVIDPNLKSEGLKPITSDPLDILQSNADKANVAASNTIFTQNQDQNQEVQLFNPYGGVSLEQSLNFAGQGFGQGNVGQGLLGSTLAGLKGARSFMSGYGMSKENQRVQDQYNQNIKEEPQYQYSSGNSFKEGGKITNGQKLTGEFITEEPKANVEIEDGEYTENSQTGQVQLAVGEKHDQGGIKTNLPDGSNVLSDFTKIGSNNAKMFKKELGINLRKTDTFATVLDKYSKKIGLDKKIKEEEEIYEKIEKQDSNKDMSDNVKAMNLEALQKSLRKVEAEKETLNAQQKEVFDMVFQEQEKKPKTENTKEMKEGGTKGDDVDFLANKYKIDRTRLLQLMEEGGGVDTRLQNFIQTAKALGYTGTTDFNLDGEIVDENFRKMQAFVAEKDPQLVIDYFTKSGQPITAQGVDTIKEQAPEVLKSLGIPADKPSAELTAEERIAVQNEFAKTDKATPDFWTNQFSDGRWEYRAPVKGIDISVDSIGTVQPQPTAEVGQVDISDRDFSEYPAKDLTTSGGTAEGNFDRKQRQQYIVPTIPQDFLLPPSARQAVRKHEVTVDRLDPQKVGIEPNLVEIERQRQAVQDVARFLPPSQRAALMANTLGQTQDATNKAIGQQSATNAQLAQQAAQYNSQAGFKEQLSNIGFAQDYETKTMQALTNQDIDVRKYFNDLNNQQRYNFDYVERRKLLNQAYDNFDTTGSDVRFTGGADFQVQNWLNQQSFYNNMSNEERKEFNANLVKQQSK